jgi:hypothetical protein
MLMRKERNPNLTQLDLFQLPAVAPAWQSLPLETQQKVETLLIQLFREAREVRSASLKKEVGDE